MSFPCTQRFLQSLSVRGSVLGRHLDPHGRQADRLQVSWMRNQHGWTMACDSDASSSNFVTIAASLPA